MISVDRLISDLTALHIDHQEVQVWVHVDVEGKPYRLPLGSMRMGLGGLSLELVGEPEPVPDVAIVAPRATCSHVWNRDEPAMLWRCVADCRVQITYVELMKHPIPRTEEQATLLLGRLADWRIALADRPNVGPDEEETLADRGIGQG